MKDVTRYLMILMIINIAFGIVGMVMSDGTQTDVYNGLQTHSEFVKTEIDQQIDSDAINPSGYQGETPFGSQKGLGLATIVNIVAEGLKPFPAPESGYENESIRLGFELLNALRYLSWAMTGILLYLVIFNKKS